MDRFNIIKALKYIAFKIFSSPNPFIMKLKLIIFLGLILIIGFATTAQNQSPSDNPSTTTPETLLPANSRKGISNYSSGRKNNIVDDLFQEAIDKDAALGELVNEIYAYSYYKKSSKIEATQPFFQYQATNKSYWRAAQQEIEQIKNPQRKDSVKEAFKLLEEAYQASIEKQINALAEIQQKAEQLSDQMIILKLCITSKMIQTYQINELPEIAELKTLIAEYDTLINQTETYCKFE